MRRATEGSSIGGMTASAVTLAREGMSRFVGRTDELGWLRRLLGEAGNGQARVALLAGAPGIGKTRLVREFLNEADSVGWQTVAGHCSRDAGTPHLPFSTGLIPQLRRANIVPEGGSELAAGEDLAMLAADLASKTAALCGRRALVFLIDDYQFGEAATLRLIGEYVRNLSETARREPLRLLLVVTHHVALPGDAFGGGLEQLRRESMVQSMELSGLAELEVNEIIREAANLPCDPQLLGVVCETTGGNPLFVLEVLRDLERRSLLRHARGYLATDGPRVSLQLPANASSALAQRIGALSAAAKELLEVGALLGDTFSLGEAVTLTGGADAEEAADEGVAAGLVVAQGSSLAFTHGIVRTAAAEGILPMRRRRLHAEIARRLIERHGEDREHALDIANHVIAAEGWPDPRAEGDIYARAGDVALDAFLTRGTSDGVRFIRCGLQ